MTDINIINYSEQGLDRLLYQFKDKPNIDGILSSFLSSLSATQTSSLEMLDYLDLNVAVGKALDDLGKIVGEKRLGNSDEVYRENISVRIFLNSSRGTPNDLLEALNLLTDSTEIAIFEHEPNHNIFYSNASTMSTATATALSKASIVTSHPVGVLHDPDNNALIPAELEIGGGILVDDQNRDIVTDQDYNIALNYLTGLASVNSNRATLPELVEVAGFRVPPEFYLSI
tara:strand:+ start:4875 stop:5561 length:687 start_codon:yes stop_codon:yes gene_type:complete